MRAIIALGLMGGMVLSAASAGAQTEGADRAQEEDAAEATSPEERAAALAREAAALIREGDCARALPKLEEAYAVLRVPTIARYSGYCMEKVGRWVDAVDRYLETTRLPLPVDKQPVHEEAQRDADDLRRALLARLPQLVLTVNGIAAPSVTLDGVPVPLARLGTKVAVDPGLHQIEVEASDGRTEKRSFTAVEGKVTSVDVAFVEPVAPAPEPLPSPAEPPPPQPPPAAQDHTDAYGVGGWTAIGVGAAGAVMAVVAGGLLLSTDADLDDECLDDVCLDEAEGRVDRFNALRPVTTAGMVVGGLGLATGITLLLLAPDEEPTEARVMPWLGPTSLGLYGRF